MVRGRWLEYRLSHGKWGGGGGGGLGIGAD